MIYLKPVGGLCNRIRAIDSMISLCRKHNRDLTVLWMKSDELDCNFHELFNHIITDDIKIYLIENPVIAKFLIAHKIEEKNFIKGSFWLNLYKLKQHIIKGFSENKINELFYNKIESQMTEILKNNNESFLIESYYRHCKQNKNSYNHFQPIESIQKKITKKILTFNNTIGVHIRRTDHIYSTKISSIDKFRTQINTTLNKNPDVTFFLSSDCNYSKETIIADFGKNIITNQSLSYNRNVDKNIQQAVLDLFCLANTKKIYGSFFSTFSQVASDINNVDNIIIK